MKTVWVSLWHPNDEEEEEGEEEEREEEEEEEEEAVINLIRYNKDKRSLQLML